MTDTTVDIREVLKENERRKSEKKKTTIQFQGSTVLAVDLN